MLALTVVAGRPATAPDLTHLAEPEAVPGELLVDAVALGVCGTDRSLVRRGVRRPPAGRDRIVLGHESLGRVVAAPPSSGFHPGDLVTGIVRRPDPGPCPACAAGDLDLCLRTDYDERGIVGRDGYGAQRYLLEPAYAVAVDPSLGLAGVLVEPASVAAKAWERIDRMRPAPDVGRRALVLGAGPIGLLAALLGVQRGYDVHVVDRVRSGPKPELVAALPATYHCDVADLERFADGFDAVVECSGELVAEAVRHTGRSGALCLVSADHGAVGEPPDLAAISRDLVGGNRTFAGIMSSNRRHFTAAQEALLRGDRAWLAGLLTPIVPLAAYRDAFEAGPDAVKAVIAFGPAPD